MDDIFKQYGNKLIVNYLNIRIYFNMPDFFNIDEVSDDLKIMSLILLFYPIDKEIINYEFTRKSSGDRIGLAFSGGVDSSAAYCLLPKDKTVLFYHKRIIDGYDSKYKNDNALSVIDKLPCEVLIIESDLEDVRQYTGTYAGFLNDFSFFAGFVLLADYLNIGYLSTGMMLESTYIKGGYKFRDFHNSDYYNMWFSLFRRAGLPLFFPCIPCSEVLNNKIVNFNNVVSQSCIRGTDGIGCGKCYKCFRKKLINGVLLHFENGSEIHKFLDKRPLKQGASLIYAMNKLGIEIELIKEYVGMDLGWLENYFEYTFQSIPQEWREYLKNELNKYTTPIITVDELKNFEL